MVKSTAPPAQLRDVIQRWAQPFQLTLALVLVALVAGCTDRKSPDPLKAALSPDEMYRNPVDNKTYVAPGGWKRYKPEHRQPDEPGRKVKSGGIRLLTPESDLAERTTPEDLAAFIREAERLADESFGKSGKKFLVIVQFTCNPTGHKIKLAHRGDATYELLQSYYDALKALKNLPVRHGEVSFQFELSVNP
jgi:hypothetical protein